MCIMPQSTIKKTVQNTRPLHQTQDLPLLNLGQEVECRIQFRMFFIQNLPFDNLLQAPSFLSCNGEAQEMICLSP